MLRYFAERDPNEKFGISLLTFHYCHGVARRKQAAGSDAKASHNFFRARVAHCPRPGCSPGSPVIGAT